MDTLDNHRRAPGANAFAFEVGDETFKFLKLRTDDRKLTGAQIAAAAGKHPVENYAILQHLTSGEIEALRPTEVVDLLDGKTTRFFVIEGANSYRFVVEGLNMEWPRPSLSAGHIKFLVGADDHDVVVLERDRGNVDLNDDELVHLGAPGLERLKLRRLPKTVTVFYKEKAFELDRRPYTTEQLLAVFSVPAAYKLDVVEGESDFRELKPGEIIHPCEGMEFSSHAPTGTSS